ncbi:alpha-galactosidase [Demequina globuliformis]|uniref:alpha-galactosidase n=1 Tax=Demequina globuliformis TaxID=676202 RepID=UPI0007827E1A|nr:alpha-galactosidase [Demequina globuliformis]
MNDHQVWHLNAAGVSFAVAADSRGARIVHWGAELTDADVEALAASDLPAVTFSSFDEPRVFPVLPVESTGWSGTPALAWHRAGALPAPHLRFDGADRAGNRLVLRWDDASAGASVQVTYGLDEWGVLSVATTVEAAEHAAGPLDVLGVRAVLPLPARASEIIDQTGRWTRERAPQRTPVRDGAHVRASRRGRPGHDAPYLTMVAEAGCGFREAEVWAAHVAFSGNHEVIVERLPEGAGVHQSALVAGELLLPGEVRLDAGEVYESPVVLCAWSGEGIDGLSARLHGHVRGRAAHPRSPRPLTLNTWEAVYFDHDPAAIEELARVAASVGVERFVLDDGWFTRRHSDSAGLGDWRVDQAKWPHGLGVLADAVHGLGMQCGLWVEPEMVNLDSDIARAHPEWILGGPDAPTWRHQLPLDLTVPEVRAHLLDRIGSLVSDHGIDYLKWDHNRELHAAVTHAQGRAAVRAQTLAAYSVMDQLGERFPELEIESCASGGARVDLGVLERTHRVWPSDVNDPVERQRVQRWTGVLLPPELVGTHVGPATAHTTHRTTDLSFRMLTALFGHAGIEWDLTQCDEDERAALRAWTATYREFRSLLHGGITVRAELADPGAILHGVVAPDASRALLCWARLETSGPASTPRVPIPGLDDPTQYRVTVREPFGAAHRHQVADPAWVATGVTMSGRALRTAGLPLPLLDPAQGLLLECVRVPA